MKIKLKVLGILLTLFFSLISVASFADCNNSLVEQGIQSAINECAYSDYKAADLELNSVYKELLARAQNDSNIELRKNIKIALKTAQQNWLKFRDSQCELEALPETSGSIQPTVRFGCLRQLTEQRTEKLRNMLLAY